jgi:acylphosphatase
MEAVRRIAHVRVEGRVQGVGYRIWCVRQATARGLEGWVRNRADGAVEAVFAGEPEGVASMLTACSGGPPMARVTAVKVEDGADDLLLARGGQAGFVVLANA